MLNYAEAETIDRAKISQRPSRTHDTEYKCVTCDWYGPCSVNGLMLLRLLQLARPLPSIFCQALVTPGLLSAHHSYLPFGTRVAMAPDAKKAKTEDAAYVHTKDVSVCDLAQTLRRRSFVLQRTFVLMLSASSAAVHRGL